MTNKHTFARQMRMITLLSICMKSLDELMDICDTDADFKFYQARYNSLKLKRQMIEEKTDEL